MQPNIENNSMDKNNDVTRETGTIAQNREFSMQSEVSPVTATLDFENNVSRETAIDVVSNDIVLNQENKEGEEQFFSNINSTEVINEEAGVVADAIQNAVKAGKIPGASEQSLEEPGFISAFLETPKGKMVMSAFRTLAIATALVSPMKNAQADTTSDIFREAVTQRTQVESAAARDGMQLEGRLKNDYVQLEGRLKNDRMQMESRFKTELASRNERDATELANFDDRARNDIAQLESNPSATQAQKQAQMTKVNTDRARIVAKQEASYQTWATVTVPSERQKFETYVQTQQQQFATYAETQRGQAGVFVQTQRSQVGTNVQVRILDELFRKR